MSRKAFETLEPLSLREPVGRECETSIASRRFHSCKRVFCEMYSSLLLHVFCSLFFIRAETVVDTCVFQHAGEYYPKSSSSDSSQSVSVETFCSCISMILLFGDSFPC